MSLATLASRLYTVKSRKNLTLGAAFTSMIREDLAMRFSVFNIVRAVTGSDFLATVMQAKYGKLTPIEKEEFSKQRKKEAQEKKFKQFTASSIVTLNNKITTLSALTERNTALILNLYNDLGFFKGQRRNTISQITTLSAVRTTIKSRTVKYQIDDIRSKLELVNKSLNNDNRKKFRGIDPKKQKNNKQTNPLSIAWNGETISNNVDKINFIGEKIGDVSTDKGTGVTVEISDSLVEELMTLLSFLPLGRAAKVAGAIIKKIRPSALKINKAGQLFGKGGVLTGATARGAQQRIASNAAAVKAGEAVLVGKNGKPLAGAALASAQKRLMEMAMKTGGSRAMQILRSIGSKIALPGAGLVGTAVGYLAVRGLAGDEGGEETDKSGGTRINKETLQKKLKPFGIDIQTNVKDGSLLYIINGTSYTKDNLPVEYKTIIDAFSSDTNSDLYKAAQQKIQAAPALYNSLIVEGPPLFQESDTALKVIAAAKAAQLTTQEPDLTTLSLDTASNIPAPSIPAIESKSKAADAVSRTVQQENIPTQKPTTELSEQKVGTETVKQIIVQAATTIGVDPGIMLAMGQQESSFNPNARPIDKKTGKLLSSAKGLFQFINSTWQNMLDKYASEFPELNRGPFDPYANALAAALYVKENSEYLRKKKIPITGTSIYATHFLGAGGAAKLFSAPENSLAVAVLPKAASSNPHIFMNNDGSSKTVGEVVDALYRKVGVKAETFTAELRAKPPALRYETGAPVSAPPMLASATTAPSEAASTMAEIQSLAALQVNQSSQQSIAALASRISTLETQVAIDAPFASVRNSSQAIPGVA